MDENISKELILSLCIPTNGVPQWVFPVLDSIYEQNVAENCFEVVVMDNGQNDDFKESIRKYADAHDNLFYYETNAYEFLSEIEAYKVARGKFIKFINHRTKLCKGTLQIYIDFIKEHIKTKPVIYFSNGANRMEKEDIIYMDSFDEFVRRLSFWSSWSTGMAFWKDDFEAIKGLENANVLFPHTNILFGIRQKKEYIIDNRKLLDEIPTGSIPKGRYNLFYAFAVEYPAIIMDLYRDRDICEQTFLKVKEDTLGFIAELYYAYIIRKKKCSYDLSRYRESICCFYSMFQLMRKLFEVYSARALKKIKFWR